MNSAVLGPVADHGCLVCEELLAIEGASWTLNLMGGPYRSFFSHVTTLQLAAILVHM